jgi:Uncharacterized protein conserved in bacteria (DUF2076)
VRPLSSLNLKLLPKVSPVNGHRAPGYNVIILDSSGEPMTPQELKQLEDYLLKLTHVGYVSRDPQAAELIAVAFARQLDAPYLAVQRCLELERQLAQARARIQQLEAQTEQVQPALVACLASGGHSRSMAA